MNFFDESLVFKLHVLENITDNFSKKKLVGSGAYGAVYKAPYDGGEIAVKKLHPLQGLNDEPFDNEFHTLSQIHHPNIVRLVGYCHESHVNFVKHNNETIKAKVMERILCFEYMQGGSLDKHITEDLCDLDWPNCYKIIRGTCEGLNHLHNELDRTIFHLDLKPTNILLDKDLTPKIADLGLSRIVNTTKTHRTERLTLQGTFGYMPPEYIEHSDISKKFDVFSLGGIIIRIMDGNKCHSRFSRMGAQQFIEHVIERWERRLQGMSGFQSHQKGILQARKCLDIGLRCVERDRNKRPSIQEIVHELEELEAEISKISLHFDQPKGTIGQKDIEIARLNEQMRLAQQHMLAQQQFLADFTTQMSAAVQTLATQQGLNIVLPSFQPPTCPPFSPLAPSPAGSAQGSGTHAAHGFRTPSPHVPSPGDQDSDSRASQFINTLFASGGSDNPSNNPPAT